MDGVFQLPHIAAPGIGEEDRRASMETGRAGKPFICAYFRAIARQLDDVLRARAAPGCANERH
jgi:hypothetical protein